MESVIAIHASRGLWIEPVQITSHSWSASSTFDQRVHHSLLPAITADDTTQSLLAPLDYLASQWMLLQLIELCNQTSLTGCWDTPFLEQYRLSRNASACEVLHPCSQRNQTLFFVSFVFHYFLLAMHYLSHTIKSCTPVQSLRSKCIRTSVKVLTNICRLNFEANINTS